MANWITYNFPSAVRGDNYGDIRFEIKTNNVAVNLTGAAIKMCLFGSFKIDQTYSTANGGIVITDAVAGKFKIVFGKINIVPKCYKHDIEITFADGTVKTWIKGQIEVLNDITK
jgi:hypothetical protein